MRDSWRASPPDRRLPAFSVGTEKPQGGEPLDWQKEFNVQVNKLRAPSSTRLLILNRGAFFIPITGGRSTHTLRPIGRR